MNIESSDSGVIFRSYRQGGKRYGDVVSHDGANLKLNFDENIYMRSPSVWNQLEEYSQFKLLSLNEIFSNSNPVFIEIGTGNGEFIHYHSVDKPDTNWIGFEVFHKVFDKAVSRAKKAAVSNVRLIQFDAELFLRLLPDHSISGFFVNFPDPWPKAKHTKRRLLKPWFIELMRQKLVLGGVITVATDHSGYAEEITGHFENAPGLKSVFRSIYVNDIGDYYKTKYYRKFAQNGTVYFYKMQKI